MYSIFHYLLSAILIFRKKGKNEFWSIKFSRYNLANLLELPIMTKMFISFVGTKCKLLKTLSFGEQVSVISVRSVISIIACRDQIWTCSLNLFNCDGRTLCSMHHDCESTSASWLCVWATMSCTWEGGSLTPLRCSRWRLRPEKKNSRNR